MANMFKNFVNDLRKLRRPNVDIISIAQSAMNDDFSENDKSLVESFPVERMTRDEKVLLTQALSTYNTEWATSENTHKGLSGLFRRDMLEKLFETNDSDDLIRVALNTESKHSSMALPYLAGKYAKDTDLIVRASERSYVGTAFHGYGVVHNENASADALTKSYEVLRGNGPMSHDIAKRIDLVASSFASHKNAPLDLLVSIESDFKHETGRQAGPAINATAGLKGMMKPVSMSTNNAKQELADWGYSADITDGSVTLTIADDTYVAKLDGDEIVGTIPNDSSRAVTAILHNQYNEKVSEAIQDSRAAHNTLSFDGLVDDKNMSL